MGAPPSTDTACMAARPPGPLGVPEFLWPQAPTRTLELSPAPGGWPRIPGPFPDPSAQGGAPPRRRAGAQWARVVTRGFLAPPPPTMLSYPQARRSRAPHARWRIPAQPDAGGARGSPGQLLQLGLGVVQAVALHVLVRGVCQELVQRQDVPGDLQGTERQSHAGGQSPWPEAPGGRRGRAGLTWNMG